MQYTSWKSFINPGKVHFEGLVHSLRYITDNKNLGLIYYAKIEDELLSDLLRQNIIKTENHLVVLYESIWKDCQDIVISIGAYIVFYQVGPIDNCKHVIVPIAQ